MTLPYSPDELFRDVLLRELIARMLTPCGFRLESVEPTDGRLRVTFSIDQPVRSDKLPAVAEEVEP
jgi:hypothetical protein